MDGRAAKQEAREVAGAAVASAATKAAALVSSGKKHGRGTRRPHPSAQDAGAAAVEATAAAAEAAAEAAREHSARKRTVSRMSTGSYQGRMSARRAAESIMAGIAGTAGRLSGRHPTAYLAGTLAAADMMERALSQARAPRMSRFPPPQAPAPPARAVPAHLRPPKCTELRAAHWADWGGSEAYGEGEAEGEGEGDDGLTGESAEGEDDGLGPVITLLYSRPQLLSAGVEDAAAEEDDDQSRVACGLLPGAARVCRFIQGEPDFCPDPANDTMRALRMIDFSGKISALPEDIHSDEDKRDDNDMDVEGIARWRRWQSVDLFVPDEERDRRRRSTESDYLSSESEIIFGKYEPIIWFPEKAQFQLYWDLWDPRASVRDVEEEEQGPPRNRQQRAADLLQEVIKYFRKAPKEGECSESSESSLEDEQDSFEGIDWYNVRYEDMDGILRHKIFKKYTEDILKQNFSKGDIRKMEICDPYSLEIVQPLRNLQYRATRWLIKAIDNEYCFLPKPPKDKILIPKDPTLDHHMTIILSEILMKLVSSSWDKLDLEDMLLSEIDVPEVDFDDRKERARSILWTELNKRIGDRSIQNLLMEGVDRYIDDKDPDFREEIMGLLEKHDVEDNLRDILESIRENAILGDSKKVADHIVDTIINKSMESKAIVAGLLDSIIDRLGEEEETEERVSEETTPEEQEEVSLPILARFNLANERCFSREYYPQLTLEHLRANLATLCQVPEDIIVLEYDGKVLLSRNILVTNTTLREIRKNDEDVMDFKLTSIDDLRYPLRTYELTLETPIITTRTIDVVMDKYETRRIHLTVEDDCIVKPYIGGYRNKATGMELHNAFTQTGPFLRKVERTHRDTQTATLKYSCIETVQHKQTQMWRRDCYITPEYDYLIRAKPYMEADAYFRLMRYEEMAIRIQRYWRRYLLGKLIRRLAAKARECKQYELERERKRLKEISERHRLVLVHKTYPRTKADFDMWYAMIEKWRVEETEKAYETKDPPGRKAALLQLHLTELELLREMDAHRSCLREEKREARELALAEACARPIAWTGVGGCIVEMDTVRTQRARDLRDLHRALARPDVTLEERVEALVQLKYALVPYNKVAANQLLRLAEREIELLVSGLRMGDQIDVLHHRVLQLHLELLKDPDYNPEAAKHILEYNIAQQEYTLHSCPRCARLRKKVDISIDATTRSLQHCATCDWVQHIGSRRYDMGPYRDLMRSIRRDEAKRQAYSSVAFVMRDADFYWLILNLWHAESFLTEQDDINDMRMPRWDVRYEWSPWNCILLTDDETKWHLRLPSLEKGYSQELMGEVHNRHVTARLHFRQLVKTDKYFRESCKWFDVSRKKMYVAPSHGADVFQGSADECASRKVR